MDSTEALLKAYTSLIDASPMLAAIVAISCILCVAVIGILFVALRSKKLMQHHTDNSDLITNAVLSLHGQLDDMNKNISRRMEKYEQRLIETSIEVNRNRESLEKHSQRLMELGEICSDCVKKVVN